MRAQINRTYWNPQQDFARAPVERNSHAARDRLDYRVTHAYFADGIQSASDFAK